MKLKLIKNIRHIRKNPDNLINIFKDLIKVEPITPYTDKFKEVIKKTNMKLDLLSEYELEKMKNYEITIFNTKRKLNIHPKIFIPSALLYSLISPFDPIINTDILVISSMLFIFYYLILFVYKSDLEMEMEKLYLNLIKKQTLN